MAPNAPPELEILTEDLGKHLIDCNRCGGKTWQTVQVLARDVEEDENILTVDEHEIIRCDGCLTISFRNVWHVGTPGSSPTLEKEAIYPPRKDRKARKRLSGSGALPVRVRSIYSETVRALNSELPVLAGIGIRALVESVCKHKRIKGKNLQQRIDGLAAAGLLGKTEAKTLHRIRFLGNKAAHEMKEPTPVELSAGMDIAEHLLETVYLLLRKARKLPSR